MAYACIRPRRGTKYEWETYNPTLKSGELVVEVPDSGVGTGLSKFKIGDGTTPYKSLPYAFNGAAAASIDGGSASSFSTIQLRGATADVWKSTNPILSEREIAYDMTNNTFKVGDGKTKWNSLPFVNAGGLVTDVVDYGDEDSAVSANNYDYITDNTSYPEHILPDGWDKNINNGGIESNDTVAAESEEDDTTTAGIDDLLVDEESEDNVTEEDESITDDVKDDSDEG